MTDITGIVLPRDVARHLAAFAINELLTADEGCCPKCCGPCWSLKKLIDEGKLDQVVKSDDTGDYYDWQDADTGKVRVEKIVAQWELGKKHLGCEDMHEGGEVVGLEDVPTPPRPVCMIPDCGCNGYAHA